MDFFKKNWGLLLYSLGCFALAVVIGLNIRSAAIQVSTKRKALDDQLQWFQGVKKENLKLTKENERAAQDNCDRAELKFTELRQTMASKYRIDPRAPATPVEAVRELQTELRAINRMLDDAEPPVDYNSCPYLSFQARAASKDLPAMEDVPKIFRHLRIIKEIASIVAGSHLRSLAAIERPMDLNVIEEDLYTATPITMTVTGTADQVQTFVNKMTTEANYLFFLRNLTLSTPDQAPNGSIGGTSSGAGAGAIAMDAGGAGAGTGAAGMGPGAGKGGPGAGMMGPAAGKGGPGAAMMGPAAGMGPGAGKGPAAGMGPGAGKGPAAGMGPGMGMAGPGAAMGAAESAGGATSARSGRLARGRRTGAAATADAGMQPPVGMGPGTGKGPAATAAGGDASRRDGNTGAAATTQEPMWRDQLRAFVQDALVTVELRFDLIEFNQPEASQPKL